MIISKRNSKYKEDFQGLVEGLKIRECTCIVVIFDDYIHQTKHDGICGYKKDGLSSSI